ncbi:Ig-like domain-containing protein [Microbacterium sp. NPDC055988]|uniref:Ig-like domain-containing protein n=1 Tax=Microbacterium sp. NPDC055988 TaxID=3345671 RepID=UPI0035D942F5
MVSTKSGKRIGRVASAAAAMVGLAAVSMTLAAPANAASLENMMTGPIAGESYFLTLNPGYGTYSGGLPGLEAAVESGAAPIWTYPSVGASGPISSDGLCLQAAKPGAAGAVSVAPCDETNPGQTWFTTSPVTFKTAKANGAMLRIEGASSVVTNANSGTNWEAGMKLAVPAAPVAPDPAPFVVLTPNLSESNTLLPGTTFTGTGEPGSTVVITDKDGNTVGETIVDEYGAWSAPISGLPQGPNNLTATETLPNGENVVIDLGPVVVVMSDESTPLMDPTVAGGVGAVLVTAAGATLVIRRRKAHIAA